MATKKLCRDSAASSNAPLGGAGDALALMSVLATEPPATVVVNEPTTVASVFTSARFI